MNTDNKIELVEIFAGSIWQSGMVKNLLENAGIKAFLKDEIMGVMNPWVAAPGGANPVKVFVSKNEINQAKQIVDEYENKLQDIH